MNIRKPADYNALFTALDGLIAASLPQMKLYCETGRLVSGRPEKGAAVAAAEYLQRTYPDTAGSSPRNLRRMRDFYRAYKSAPEIMAEAMTIGWTQNVVILEAELTLQEKAWYIRAVQQFKWSKLELARQIASAAHLEIPLDLRSEMCYTGENNSSEYLYDDENPLYLPWEYLPQPDGRVCDEGPGEESRSGITIPHRVRRHQYGRNWKPGLSPARRKLAEHGIDCAGKTARQLTNSDYSKFDLLIGMDRANLRNMHRICGDPTGKLHLLMDYTDRPGDVADPWYTNDFDITWRDVLEGCTNLLERLNSEGKVC